MDNYNDDDHHSRRQSYSLKQLKEYMKMNNFLIINQFIYDDTIIFIQVKNETIGENILIYFPSKYNILLEEDIPSIDISSVDLSEEDIFLISQEEKDSSKEDFKELQLNSIISEQIDENYNEIKLNKSETQIKRQLFEHTQQLDKFKNFVKNIPYKMAILTNNTLCVINRHNTIDCYNIQGKRQLIKHLIDKGDKTVNIEKELYIMIDLENFFEKIKQFPDDILSFYKHFYKSLSDIHTKQTSNADIQLKVQLAIINKMKTSYETKSKYLELISKFNKSLEQCINKERKLMEDETDNKDYILSQNETELENIRRVKADILKNIIELKAKYNNFIINYDYAIADINKSLKRIQGVMTNLEL